MELQVFTFSIKRSKIIPIVFKYIFVNLLISFILKPQLISFIMLSKKATNKDEKRKTNESTKIKNEKKEAT